MIYQMIEQRLAQRVIAQNLKQLFAINITGGEVNRLKSKVARLYNDTYEGILNRIVNGRLAHADETKINILGKSGYVWVFANHEEVVYFYTDTREADTPERLLKGFTGVLVSDFYAAYDSIEGPQQKCLIHLMRDLDADIRKQPFNNELKELVEEFAMLLKAIIETIDRF
jgi:Transposase IS66 family